MTAEEFIKQSLDVMRPIVNGLEEWVMGTAVNSGRVLLNLKSSNRNGYGYDSESKEFGDIGVYSPKIFDNFIKGFANLNLEYFTEETGMHSSSLLMLMQMINSDDWNNSIIELYESSVNYNNYTSKLARLLIYHMYLYAWMMNESLKGALEFYNVYTGILIRMQFIGN